MAAVRPRPSRYSRRLAAGEQLTVRLPDGQQVRVVVEKTTDTRAQIAVESDGAFCSYEGQKS
jgi:hypothetical protein